VNARTPRVGLFDLAAVERAEQAAYQQSAVYRRMQALRRSAQLAEAAGLDTPHRRRASKLVRCGICCGDLPICVQGYPIPGLRNKVAA
jgi:hypothetical protein